MAKPNDVGFADAIQVTVGPEPQSTRPHKPTAGSGTNTRTSRPVEASYSRTLGFAHAGAVGPLWRP